MHKNYTYGVPCDLLCTCTLCYESVFWFALRYIQRQHIPSPDSLRVPFGLGPAAQEANDYRGKLISQWLHSSGLIPRRLCHSDAEGKCNINYSVSLLLLLKFVWSNHMMIALIAYIKRNFLLFPHCFGPKGQLCVRRDDDWTIEGSCEVWVYVAPHK